MKNVSASPPAINRPSDLLLLIHNKLVEAIALSGAVADELCALPVGTVPEPLQGLANVSERIIQEAFATFEELAGLVEPPAPPVAKAPNN